MTDNPLDRVPGGDIVRIHDVDDVAIVVIDNPPVNAGNARLRQGLLRAVEEVSARDLGGVVLAGAGGSFVAGSDISEFDGALAEPEMPAVLEAIERCPHTVVAALDGYTLGGGLEIALACDARVSLASTVLGLPEVTLGMIPGAGGTQRLPRIVGRAHAARLAATGDRITAEEALEMGLVNRIAEPGDLLDAAIDAARSLPKQDLTAPFEVDGDGFDEAAERLAAKAGGRPEVLDAIRMVGESATRPIAEGLLEERAEFNRLRATPAATALRHMFFAERAASRPPSSAGGRGAMPSTVGVIGAGTMGVGIATAALFAGASVTLVDQTEAAVATGLQRVRDNITGAVTRKKMTQEAADAAEARLAGAASIAEAGAAEFVIEAVFEDRDVKLAALRQLEDALAEDAIIASNTSYLDLNVLAAEMRHPERFIGMHFFNPAHVMKLVEVVPVEATSGQVTAATFALAKKMGKVPVLSAVAEGFIGNRIYKTYRRHVEFLIEDGAYPEQVDRALTEFGMALGPFATADLSGLDIAAAMRAATAHLRDPRDRYVTIPDNLVAAGRLGKKTGAGYYAYPEGRPVPDPAAREIIEAGSREAGIERREISDEEIVARAIGAMVNEAAHAVADGVARSAGDVDVVEVLGFGFPRRKGGPLWWAAHEGADVIEEWIGLAREAEGPNFRAAPVREILAAIRGEDAS